MTKSEALFERAQTRIPGGVNSPVRAFKAVGGTPRFMERSDGAYIFDADGNKYIDYVLSWGPMIMGHNHPRVRDAVVQTAQDGLSFGCPTEIEIELAERLCDLVPSLEQVRMTSSGTEATMSAIRLARGATGRDKIIKFEGCYHGHVDSLMVSSGSGLATFGIASSPGIPNDTVATTLICPLDDIEAVEFLFREHGDEIAAIIIEPLPANNGLLIQRSEFLSRLRSLCDDHDSLLIFDEVISGFRFKHGSYSDICGVTPDITALGKVIGGGLPVGAYGARDEIMQKLSPLGPVYQAGTLSGNPLAMAAGAKTLDLLDEQAYDYLEDLGAFMEERVGSVLEKHGFPMRLVRMESLFWFSPGDADPAIRADHIPKNAGSLYADVHRELLDRGYMLAPSAYEIGFLSTSHDESHILGFVEALDDSLSNLDWS